MLQRSDKPSHTEARALAVRIRNIVTKIMGKRPEAAADLAPVLDALMELESLLLHLTATASDGPKFLRERRTLDDYTVEPNAQDANTEMLVERRKRSGGVLRASKDAYEAAVSAFVGKPGPISFDDLMHLCQRHGQDMDAYQIRVALRVLQSLNPPLVLRRQAKYMAAHKETLAKDARAAWAHLRDRPRVRIK